MNMETWREGLFQLCWQQHGGSGLAVTAAEPTPPRAGVAQPRSGQTRPFGSGSITNRSDGSTSPRSST